MYLGVSAINLAVAAAIRFRVLETLLEVMKDIIEKIVRYSYSRDDGAT